MNRPPARVPIGVAAAAAVLAAFLGFAALGGRPDWGDAALFVGMGTALGLCWESLEGYRRRIARQAGLLDRSSDAIFAWEPGAAGITYWNAGAERLFGLPRADALGRDPLELLGPDAARGLTEVYESGEWSGPLEARTSVGGTVAVEARRTLVRERGRTLILEVHRAAAEWRRGEQRLRRLADSMPQIVYVSGPDGSVEYLNARWHDYTGLPADRLATPEEVLGVVHPDDRESVHAAWRAAVAAGSDYEVELRLRRADGAYRWHLSRAEPVDDDGVRRWFGTSTDIHDLKAAQKATAASEARFRLATEAVNGLVYEYDYATDAVWRSAGLTALVGFAPDEVPASAAWWNGRVHPEDRPALEALVARRPPVSQFSVEYRVRHRDGRYFRVWDQAIVEFGPDGEPRRAVGCTVDVTAQRETAARLKAFMEHSPGSLFVKDAEGRYAAVNGAFEEATGRPTAEILGRTDAELFPPELAERFAAQDEAVRAAGVAQRFEDTFERDGLAHTFLSHKFPLPDGAIGCVGTDISGRKRIERELARQHRETERERSRLQAVLDALPVAVILSDAGGRLLQFNDAVERLWGAGYPHSGSAGEYGAWVAWWPDSGRQLAADEWALARALREGVAVPPEEVRIRRFDGGTAHILNSAAPVLDADGSLIGGVVASMDIGELKRAQEALREADRRKDEFLATLAHELRNPLAPIRYGLKTLKLAFDDPAAAAEARAMMERQLAQMVRLIDDLLDVSRITRGKLQLRVQRTSVRAAVEAALEAARPALEEAGHRLEVALPDAALEVDGDPARLAQVFSNLLTNAAKYTDAGGTVVVSSGTEPGAAWVRVADTGIGLTSEQLTRVFEMFSQVERAIDRSQGGLGIGLALVRGLVEMHGGTVWAESEGPGRGSAFTVRLPLAGAAPQAATVPAAPAATGVGRKLVLVVDDNRDAAASLAMLLRLLGHDAVTGHDGQAAVDLAEARRPDAILLDIGLPRLNGYEACAAIRARPHLSRTPIFALTGWGQDEDRRKSQEAGFDRHFTKPVDPDALAAALAGA